MSEKSEASKLKPILKKHVHFGKNEGEKDGASWKPKVSSTSYNSRSTQMKATRFGKGKANPLRDLMALVGIIAVLMMITMNFDITGTNDEKVFEDTDEERHDVVADTLNGMANSVARSVQSLFEKQTVRSKRTEECSLFLDRGSILGTGYTYFAGRRFSVGEVVISEAKSILPLGVSSLASHAFLLKHHPSLANVEGVLFSNDETGDTSYFQLRAIRPIEAGEELFVDIQKHPSTKFPKYESVFADIPSVEEYEIADAIIDDAILTARNMAYVHRKKFFRIKKEVIFSLVHRSVHRVNPRVGALLPRTTRTAKDRNGVSSSILRLSNRTLQHHQFISSCLDDIQVAVKGDESRTVKVTQSFKKGQVITVVPLYISSDLHDADSYCANIEEEEECAVASHPYVHYCWSVSDPSVATRFCPLTEAIYLSHDKSSDNGANVELQWIEYDKLREASLTELENKPVGQVAWNLVALRDIEAGQEVRRSHCADSSVRDQEFSQIVAHTALMNVSQLRTNGDLPPLKQSSS